jgi:N4-gp56 family major capsid protein
MANAYTGTSAVAGLVKSAYDRYVEFALRSQPMFRSLADKRPVQQAMPGSSVVFSLYQDLAAATSTLTETTDPDAVAISNVNTVSVTLNEYGNTVLNTRKLGEFAFSDVDPAVANIVAFNMADSIDQVVVSTLIGGSNVLYGTGGATTPTTTNTVAAEDTITGADIRKAVAKLRASNAVPREGMLYATYMHPEVAHDLRAETGALSFEDIRKYTDPNVGNVLNAVTGVYGGTYVVETPRAYTATDGDSSAKVYRTIIAGQQALAEATAVEPGVVLGPVVDKLMRFRPIGWYSLQGWARYREAALYRIESSSSIAS